MKKIFVFLVLILVSLYPPGIFANTCEVEATGEYVMGDRDTKADARLIALEHAKLHAIEQIGTYLESEKVVNDNQLTKNEIRSYAAAIVKTIVLSEDIKLLQNKTTIFSLKIRANVDISMLENKIKEIKTDAKRNQQISSLQSENIRLLKEIETLSEKLKSEKTHQYRRLIQEREYVFDKLDKNQKSIRLVFDKGTLLGLSRKSKAELEESKKNVDDALQFIVENTVFNLGDLRIRNKGGKSDLIISLDWAIQKTDELLSTINLFLQKPRLTVFEEIPISCDHFKGINKNTLADYFESKTVRMKIQAGRWNASVDMISYVDGIHYIKTRNKTTLTISDIPTDQLGQMTGIEGKVVVEANDDQLARR